MRRVFLFIIAGLVVFAAVLATYKYVLDSPVITLPSVQYQVKQGSSMYDIQQKLGVRQLAVTIFTNGTVTINGDNSELAYISFNPQSLRNAVNLSTKVMVPASLEKYRWGINLLAPVLGGNIFITSLFLYHIVPVQLTLLFLAW